MARKRRVVYPPPKTSKKVPPTVPGAEPRAIPTRTVSIDLSAVTGRGEFRVGDRVRILSGLFEGETAVVESVAGGVIPAVQVRTEAGRTRRTRTIDLEPYRAPAEPRPEPAPTTETPAPAAATETPNG